MKRILILLSCLLFVRTYLYSAELAKDSATGWKIVLPDEPTMEPSRKANSALGGVYDRQGKKSLKSMVLHAKDFATEDGSFDREFRWIDLGVIDFVPGAYFWFAHGHNPALDAIFVDRVVLIGAE